MKKIEISIAGIKRKLNKIKVFVDVWGMQQLKNGAIKLRLACECFVIKYIANTVPHLKKSLKNKIIDEFLTISCMKSLQSESSQRLQMYDKRNILMVGVLPDQTYYR